IRMISMVTTKITITQRAQMRPKMDQKRGGVSRMLPEPLAAVGAAGPPGPGDLPVFMLQFSVCGRIYNAQSMGSMPCFMSHWLALEKWRQPKNPLSALKGEG